MNAYTIDLLASLNPDTAAPAIPALSYINSHKVWSPLHDAARNRFLAKYVSPSFGYYIALQFANRKLPFPVCLMGRDQWVYKAYLMKLDPIKHFNHNIAEAYHLSSFVKDAPNLGQQLRALLLSFSDTASTESHIHSVHQQTKVPLATVDAFEILFFNVLDRREDSFYLAREVYPETRMVEFDENYLKNSTASDLLKRVAYNHRNMDLTAYLSGLGDHTYLRKLAASDDREADLTRYLMGNGLILAHSNLLNQRSIGMSRVSSLLAASRQGGADQEEPTMSGIAPMFSNAFRKATALSQETALNQLRKDYGAALE
jgi:hypothetical protein